MESISINPQIHPSWLRVLNEEFHKPYFKALKLALLREKQMKQEVYPPGPLIFEAFNSCPFEKVKVVILGQDPYHNPGQAHGLSFSVPKGKRIPPSLVNIYKELKLDLGIEIPQHGNLSAWSKQGVFLLNAMLTVRANSPASHQKIGWQIFTDQVIKCLSREREGLVFMFWGKFAQQKTVLVDGKRHLILCAPHPSPFSADRGFFGCGHFSTCNSFLKERGKSAINWSIPS